MNFYGWRLILIVTATFWNNLSISIVNKGTNEACTAYDALFLGNSEFKFDLLAIYIIDPENTAVIASGVCSHIFRPLWANITLIIFDIVISVIASNNAGMKTTIIIIITVYF